MNSHWSDHRHDTKILEHIYLKSVIPLTPSVEKIMHHLHGFQLVYKPRNINVLFSHCKAK
jgi:hypothetical protein